HGERCRRELPGRLAGCRSRGAVRGGVVVAQHARSAPKLVSARVLIRSVSRWLPRVGNTESRGEGTAGGAGFGIESPGSVDNGIVDQASRHATPIPSSISLATTDLLDAHRPGGNSSEEEPPPGRLSLWGVLAPSLGKHQCPLCSESSWCMSP